MKIYDLFIFAYAAEAETEAEEGQRSSTASG